MVKTLNQERAEFCLEVVEAIKENLKIRTSDGKDKQVSKDKFSTYSKRLPSLIITNGLLPTLAFLFSKNDSTPVGYALSLWLKKQGYLKANLPEISKGTNGKINIDNNTKFEILKKLSGISSANLRVITLEALSLSDWLKRTVEAVLDERDGAGGNESWK